MENKAAYKDLMVWQRSMEFASAVIDISEKLDSERKHYRLIEQLEAAATSVPMNIAEGKGRLSKKRICAFFNHCARFTLRNDYAVRALSNA